MPWWWPNAVAAGFGFLLLLLGAGDHFGAHLHDVTWNDTDLSLVWAGVALGTGSAVHAGGKQSPQP